ncbi:MAG: hypothetical protein GYA15_12885 [Leptolinea sp.]|nr:hypothetical protein [Leptolinea sp.]
MPADLAWLFEYLSLEELTDHDQIARAIGQGLADGLTITEIAGRMGMSEKAVGIAIAELMTWLGAADQEHLVIELRRYDLIQ